MFIDQTIITDLAVRFSGYSFLIAFIVPAIGGEAAVLLLTFLAGQGLFSLWVIIIGSFLGMLALDTFWFLLARSPKAKGFTERLLAKKNNKKIEAHLESFSHHSSILILFFSKVLIGTRILVLVYLSLRKLPFKVFFLYDALVTFFWSVLLGYIGWFAGKGFYSVSQASHNLTLGAFALTGIVVVFYGLLWGIRLWMEKK